MNTRPREIHAAPPPVLDVGGSSRGQPVTKATWALLAAVVLLGLVRAATLVNDPQVPLLQREGGAQWVFCDVPFELRAKSPSDLAAGFRTLFHIDSSPAQAVLTVRALRDAKIELDGRPLGKPHNDPALWRQPFEVDLAPLLSPGDHALMILARHVNGPPGLLAHCEAIGLHTDESWEATTDGEHWLPVRTADAVPMTEYRAKSLTCPEAIAKVAWPLSVLAGAVIVLVFWSKRASRTKAFGPLFSAASIRWLLLAAWTGLILNNLFSLPVAPDFGFDQRSHLDYIATIVEKHRLPLATDGWQAFQSPLYYLVAAAWQGAWSAVFGPEGAARMLRLLSMLCGMAQVEIVFRTLRTVLPGRQDLQAMGTVLGSMLPMNLYISQSYGNEPLAGALTAATIGMAMTVLYGSDRCCSLKWLGLLGLVWGLALLTKVTGLLLAGPLAIWLIAVGWSRGERIARIAASLVCVFGTAGLVCGWFYVRNWILLGKPFVSGWDPACGIAWWQDPGFRTLHSVLSFGDALIYPCAAHTLGFFDSMYATFWCDAFSGSAVSFDHRPPWNESFMISGPLLALVPATLMVAGAIRAAVNRQLPGRAAILWSVALVGTYFAAVLDLYLRIPIYCMAKATYTLGLTPAYALLFTSGADAVMKNTVGRSITCALLVCWAVASFLAFFVR